jgi:hypothetical protein
MKAALRKRLRALEKQGGNRLLRKPEVRARVEQLTRVVSGPQIETIVLDRAWVVAMLRKNVKRALRAEPIRDREGNPIGEYTYQGGVVNKALELLGKDLGMFRPKQESENVSVAEVEARLIAARTRMCDVTLTWEDGRLIDPESSEVKMVPSRG